MPDEGFKWRPNDNSAQTNLRYTLEAEKWVNAVSSAQRKARPRSISGDLAFISMVFQLVFSVSLLILLGLLHLVKGLVRVVESGLKNKTGRKEEDHTAKETEDNEGKNPDAVWNFEKETGYPRGLQLIFYTEYGRLRHIWQFLYLLVVLGLLSLWIPDYVHINKEVLIFAGAISLWNAFLGVDD